jgi:hypothetical protein
MATEVIYTRNSSSNHHLRKILHTAITCKYDVSITVRLTEEFHMNVTGKLGISEDGFYTICTPSSLVAIGDLGQVRYVTEFVNDDGYTKYNISVHPSA